LEQIGIHDPFLELGGHSMLAMQIVARVGDAFQVEVPLRALLEAPTVADMAEFVTQRQAERLSSEEIMQLLGYVEGLSKQGEQHCREEEAHRQGP
jgi:acyl carrier protein